jgi:hypothetical protein
VELSGGGIVTGNPIRRRDEYGNAAMIATALRDFGFIVPPELQSRYKSFRHDIEPDWPLILAQAKLEKGREEGRIKTEEQAAAALRRGTPSEAKAAAAARRSKKQGPALSQLARKVKQLERVPRMSKRETQILYYLTQIGPIPIAAWGALDADDQRENYKALEALRLVNAEGTLIELISRANVQEYVSKQGYFLMASDAARELAAKEQWSAREAWRQEQPPIPDRPSTGVPPEDHRSSRPRQTIQVVEEEDIEIVDTPPETQVVATKAKRGGLALIVPTAAFRFLRERWFPVMKAGQHGELSPQQQTVYDLLAGAKITTKGGKIQFSSQEEAVAFVQTLLPFSDQESCKSLGMSAPSCGGIRRVIEKVAKHYSIDLSRSPTYTRVVEREGRVPGYSPMQSAPAVDLSQVTAGVMEEIGQGGDPRTMQPTIPVKFRRREVAEILALIEDESLDRQHWGHLYGQARSLQARAGRLRQKVSRAQGAALEKIDSDAHALMVEMTALEEKAKAAQTELPYTPRPATRGTAERQASAAAVRAEVDAALALVDEETLDREAWGHLYGQARSLQTRAARLRRGLPRARGAALEKLAANAEALVDEMGSLGQQVDGAQRERSTRQVSAQRSLDFGFSEDIENVLDQLDEDLE